MGLKEAEKYKKIPGKFFKGWGTPFSVYIIVGNCYRNRILDFRRDWDF
jgi:hypothetical protein